MEGIRIVVSHFSPGPSEFPIIVFQAIQICHARGVGNSEKWPLNSFNEINVP